MIFLTHKNRVKVEKMRKRANRHCAFGLMGLGAFGWIAANPDKLEEFVNKAIAECEEIKKIEDHDENQQKKLEWLIFRAAPVLAFLGLPIVSVLAILRSNKLHNQVFDISKDDLYDNPQSVMDVLKERFGDQT